jgi:hypothetical protein
MSLLRKTFLIVILASSGCSTAQQYSFWSAANGMADTQEQQRQRDNADRAQAYQVLTQQHQSTQTHCTPDGNGGMFCTPN